MRVKRLQRRSIHQRKKFEKQFYSTPPSRHWCFEYIRSDDGLVDISRLDSKVLQRFNLEKQWNARFARFFQRLRDRYKERLKQRERDIDIINELAQRPSSEVSVLGSIYSEFDIEEENIRLGKVMITDEESDFDLRMQKKIAHIFMPNKLGKRKINRIQDVWTTVFEEHLIKGVKKWPTRKGLRSSHQPSFIQKLNIFFKKVMKHGRSKIVLSNTEFYLCLLLYEFNMSQLVSFGNAFNQGGIGASVVIYLLCSILIQMPFNMWIITMVSYSGSLSLRLFSDCTPLVSAVRYPIFLAFVIAESRRLLNFEAVVKFMFLTLIKGKVWKNCTLESANELCVPFFTKQEHNVNCTKPRQRGNNYEFFSTQFFVQHDVFEIGNIGEELSADRPFWGDKKAKYYGPALAVLTFLIAANGIGVLRKITIKAQILVMILAGICVVSVATHRFITFYVFVWNYTNITMSFVVNFISLSLQINSLPILMWLASIKPPNLNPATCSCVHQAIKLLVLMLMSITYSALAFDISKRYKMANIECFTLEGADIVFSMAPDLFATFRFSTIWQMTWLTCMVLIALIYSVYMILAASDSLIQIIPTGDTYAALFMFIVTLTVIGLRLINEIPYVYQTMMMFELRGLNYINNFHFGLCVICIYFIYTPLRLSHEYEFTFGSQPAMFWIISWHYMIFIGLLVVIVTLLELLRMRTRTIAQFIFAGLFIICSVWLLFVNCILLAYHAFKKRTLNELCLPTIRWGPPTKYQRAKLRRLERRQRLKMRYHCRHNCFIAAPQFAAMDGRQVDAMNKVEIMRNTGVYKWYIKETILKEETVQFFNSTITDD